MSDDMSANRAERVAAGIAFIRDHKDVTFTALPSWTLTGTGGRPLPFTLDLDRIDVASLEVREPRACPLAMASGLHWHDVKPAVQRYMEETEERDFSPVDLGFVIPESDDSGWYETWEELDAEWVRQLTALREETTS